jgi:hypothetical protein
LAVLTLLCELAEEQPLICVVDDAQWLDQASAQTLEFVARRLATEPVGLVFAVRETDEEPKLAGLPELQVRGLATGDAAALLASAVPGTLDSWRRWSGSAGPRSAWSLPARGPAHRRVAPPQDLRQAGGQHPASVAAVYLVRGCRPSG